MNPIRIRELDSAASEGRDGTAEARNVAPAAAVLDWAKKLRRVAVGRSRSDMLGQGGAGQGGAGQGGAGQDGGNWQTL